jgi:hypothetical protein
VDEQTIKRLERESQELDSQLLIKKRQIEILKSGSYNYIKEAEAKVCCLQSHQLKPKTMPNPDAQIMCDICCMELINMKHNFYFRCDFSCNYDVCVNCYYASLVPKEKDLLTAFKRIGDEKRR